MRADARAEGIRLAPWWRLGLVAGLALAGLGSVSALLRPFDVPGPVRPPAPEVISAPTVAEPAEGPHPAVVAPARLPAMRLSERLRRVVEVRRGDTLVALLQRAGMGRAEAHEVADRLAKGPFDPRGLRPGQALELELERRRGSVRLAGLSIPVDFAREVRLLRTDEGYAVREVALPVVRRPQLAAGTIEDSLYLAAQAQGVPAALVMELVRLLSWDVDFQRDIQPGDRFELLYEQEEQPERGERRLGDILFAALHLSGSTVAFYRFERADGRVDYYDPRGRSLRKSLLRTPVDGVRISSGFGMRLHPILGYTRMHKGVDFAAPSGTPVYAAGDGVIEFVGWRGAYGNYIRIRHNSRYETAYAHLSRFAEKIRRGARVRQGQVIGYVGNTGRSTGPHLHYEILVNGSHVNPLTVRQPSNEELAGRELEQFRKTVAAIDALRARLARAQLVASRE